MAAADPACGYAWGIGLVHFLLAQALLLRPAQRLGQSGFHPMRPTAEVREVLAAAADHLATSREVRTRIQDPALRETESLLQEVGTRVLTGYPLRSWV